MSIAPRILHPNFQDRRHAERWTPDRVRARLEEAAETLKRLPAVGCFPAALRAQWPDVVRTFWEAYGADAPCRPRVRPHPAAISRMDEALPWLRWVDDPGRRMVCFARAAGVGEKRLAEEIAVSRATIGRWRKDAEGLIADRLAAGDHAGEKNTLRMRRRFAILIA